MEKLKSYISSKTEIREKGGISGNGLFARDNIKKGELIFIKAGHVVDLAEMTRLEKELGDYYLQIHEDFFLSPTSEQEVRDTAIYINHSCEPNVGPEGQVIFFALRDIEAGEELCYDYAMTTTHPYNLECNCGAECCRGVISGNDWKRQDLQDKYGEHFTSFILRKMKQL